MSSKSNILGRLRAAQTPFMDYPAVTQHRDVAVVNTDVTLVEAFVQQAHKLAIHTLQPANDEEAIEAILRLIGEDQDVLAWDFTHIPLAGLDAALKSRGIKVLEPRDGNVRVGITGVDAAFAATASIVVSAQTGKPRSVSLLPYVHIAIIHENQILPNFEAWKAQMDMGQFRQTGNTVIITGASRTADIAMELVHGAHGPAQLHCIIVN